MKKKFLNIISCLLIISMVIAGCGSSNRNSGDSEASDRTTYPENSSDTNSVTDTSGMYNQGDTINRDTTSTNNRPNF